MPVGVPIISQVTAISLLSLVIQQYRATYLAFNVNIQLEVFSSIPTSDQYSLNSIMPLLIKYILRRDYDRSWQASDSIALIASNL